MVTLVANLPYESQILVKHHEIRIPVTMAQRRTMKPLSQRLYRMLPWRCRKAIGHALQSVSLIIGSTRSTRYIIAPIHQGNAHPRLLTSIITILCQSLTCFCVVASLLRLLPLLFLKSSASSLIIVLRVLQLWEFAHLSFILH